MVHGPIHRNSIPENSNLDNSWKLESLRAIIDPPKDMVGQTIGRYRIEEKLGEGGMGVVYRAHDTRLGRMVALKMLRPELAALTGLQKRLSTEAHAASVLNHPSVATLYDFDTVD